MFLNIKIFKCLTVLGNLNNLSNPNKQTYNSIMNVINYLKHRLLRASSSLSYEHYYRLWNSSPYLRQPSLNKVSGAWLQCVPWYLVPGTGGYKPGKYSRTDLFCRAKPKSSNLSAYFSSKQILPVGLAEQYCYLNPYSTGIDFRRQNLTSMDVTF